MTASSSTRRPHPDARGAPVLTGRISGLGLCPSLRRGISGSGMRPSSPVVKKRRMGAVGGEGKGVAGGGGGEGERRISTEKLPPTEEKGRGASVEAEVREISAERTPAAGEDGGAGVETGADHGGDRGGDGGGGCGDERWEVEGRGWGRGDDRRRAHRGDRLWDHYAQTMFFFGTSFQA